MGRWRGEPERVDEWCVPRAARPVGDRRWLVPTPEGSAWGRGPQEDPGKDRRTPPPVGTHALE